MKPSIILFALLFAWPSFGQDCLPGWEYFQEVTIDNSLGGDFTDFQVKLEINTAALVSAGKLNADGSDLRFTDGDCNPLPYFMDSLATNPDNIVWVKVPMLTSGGSLVIRMYYGNTDAAPAASGDDTFIFFDDFESGTVDLSKWEPVGGYATLEVVDGVLNYASDGMNPGPRFKFVRTAMSFSGPVLFELAAEVTNSTGFGFSSADEPIERVLYRQSGEFGFDTLNLVAIMLDTISNGFATNITYPLIRYPSQTMQDAAILARINASNHLETNLFANLSSSSANTSADEVDAIEMTGFHFIVSSFLAPSTVYLDYLRVRKPALNPPTASFGVEQDNPATTAVIELAPAGMIRVFPNPASDLVQIESRLNEPLEVSLFDPLGRLVYHGQQLGAIDLSSLSGGLYQLVLRRAEDRVVVYSEGLVIE